MISTPQPLWWCRCFGKNKRTMAGKKSKKSITTVARIDSSLFALLGLFPQSSIYTIHLSEIGG